MKRTLNKNTIVFIMFGIMILAGLYGECIQGLFSNTIEAFNEIKRGSVKTAINVVKKSDNISTDKLLYHDTLIDINSIKNNLINTRFVQKSGNTVKCESDMLSMINQERFDKSHLQSVANRVSELQKKSESVGADFIYLAVPEKGYYSYNGNTYYSFGDYSYVDDSDRWAVYNTASGEWETADVSAIPEFKKNRKAKDYYLSRDYSNDYDFPTISDTRLYYDNSYKPGYVTTGYYSYDDNEYYRMDSYDTSSWYVYSDEYDDWRSVSSSDVPEALTNQYDAKDFYYVPNWNSDTQITDFKDTEYYAQYERDQEAERQSSYSSSDDSWSSNDSSDYSWSSSDSWDSGSSDWSSDW